MALNVEQITNRLAQMPDQALQKYAAMNKNDPYIVALAVSESNRRKQMRQAAQGAQGQMPQPKVVDAAVQGMAAPMPEDMGIARLPAGEMNFADGGIVAFADGGDVERYNGMTGSFTGDTYADTMGFGVSPELLAMDETRRLELLRRRKAAEDAERMRFLETAAPETAARLRTEQQPKVMGATPQELAQFDAATNLYMTERAGRQGAPKLDTTQRGPGAPAAPKAGLLGLQDLTKLRADISAQQKFVDPAKEEVEAFGKEGIAGAERRQKSFEDFIAKQGDVYKGREERLTQREGELGKMKDQNLGLALLQAGAAMMSTPGNLGMALGKGIDTGSKQYVAGIDKIRAAQDRLADARDKMEELRLNRDEMTFKQRAAYEADIDKAKLDAKKLSIDGIRLAADVNEKRANSIFDKTVDLAKTEYEQQQANARAAAANRPSADIQLIERIAKEKNIPFSQAYQEVVSTKREPQTQETLMKAWSANPAIQLQYPNPQDYIRMMQGSTGLGGAAQLNPSDRALIERYTR